MIDAHIQLIFPEILAMDEIKKEKFITLSFPSKKDFNFLKVHNGYYCLKRLQDEKFYKNWKFFCYGFSCKKDIINHSQNKLLLKNAKLLKEKIIPIAVINPFNYSPENLDFIKNNFSGVHFKLDWISPEEKNSDKLNYFFECLDKNNLILFLHMNYIYSISNKSSINYVEFLSEILSRFPNLNIVLEHCGGGIFLAETYDLWQRKFKSIFYSISSPRSLKLIKLLFDVVPEERIIFGSDYPFCNNMNPFEYKNILQKELPNINFENLGLRLFNLTKN